MYQKINKTPVEIEISHETGCKIFREILENYILDFLPIKKVKSTYRLKLKNKILNNVELKELIYKENDIIYFYPCKKNPPMRFEAKINNFSQNISLKFVRHILKELLCVSPLVIKEHRFYLKHTNLNKIYEQKIYDTAVEIGICSSLIGNKDKTMYSLIEALRKWSSKTYEGKKVPFGVIFVKEKLVNDKPVNILDFLKNDSSAVFTDGITSWFEVDKDANLIRHSSITNEKIATNEHEILAPFMFTAFAKECFGNRVGIVLLTNGELLIFANNRLMFAYRNRWLYYDYDRFAGTIFKCLNIDNKPFIHSIYLSVLDSSYAHTGACLAIIPQDINDKSLFESDKLTKEYHSKQDKEKERKLHEKKQVILKTLNGLPFYELQRRYRQELLALDGATIITLNGEVMAAGSIISVKSGSSGGGRTAAAKRLGKLGYAIKISEDGYIECYSKINKNCDTVYTLK